MDVGRDIGVVAGYALKLIRGSLSMTQADLAERLGVDVSTVQGWETGRRPLAALRTSDLVRLRYRLTLLGATPAVVGVLHEAIEADMILTTAITAGDQPIPPAVHPLAAAVHRRGLINLVTWSFTGITPGPLRGLQRGPSRGPVADRPGLDAVARERFFDHMLITADRRYAEATSLMRRQACYLLGFDDRTSSADWLRREHERAIVKPVADRDIPSGIAGRSAALALARHGDPEPVRHFIDNILRSQAQDLANLTYWAYWLGEIPDTYSDDAFMTGAPSHIWAGTGLLAHLVDRLEAPGHAELNIHSLWTLVLVRPHLLEQHPTLRDRVAASVEKALDDSCTARAQEELANLRCAVQLASRR